MPPSRIFVSYVCVGDEPGARIGKKLLSDIRATGNEAVADHEAIADERFMPFLLRELPQCGRLIVVQTPKALQSWRVQSTLSLASTLKAQQKLQAIRVIAEPLENAEEPPLWTALTSFDASIDYLRVRERVFLVLGLIQIDASESFLVPQSLLASQPMPVVPVNRPPLSQPPAPTVLARPSLPRTPMPSGSGGIVAPTQPSLPVPPPVGSNWGRPSPNPVPQPARANWPPPPQPPPYAPAGRTNWPPPPPPPSEPQPGLVAAQILSKTRIAQEDQSGFSLKHIWLKVRTFVTGLGKTSKLQP